MSWDIIITSLDEVTNQNRDKLYMRQKCTLQIPTVEKNATRFWDIVYIWCRHKIRTTTCTVYKVHIGHSVDRGRRRRRRQLSKQLHLPTSDHFKVLNYFCLQDYELKGTVQSWTVNNSFRSTCSVRKKKLWATVFRARSLPWWVFIQDASL